MRRFIWFLLAFCNDQSLKVLVALIALITLIALVAIRSQSPLVHAVKAVRKGIG